MNRLENPSPASPPRLEPPPSGRRRRAQAQPSRHALRQARSTVVGLKGGAVSSQEVLCTQSVGSPIHAALRWLACALESSMGPKARKPAC